MTVPEDRRLRTAIAIFDAVMRQSQFAGPDRDGIDVILEAGDETFQVIRVTYTTNSVDARVHGGIESIRQGPSVKVGTTLRLVRPEDAAAPIQMEIGDTAEPFEASNARVRLQRILMDEAGKSLRAQLGR